MSIFEGADQIKVNGETLADFEDDDAYSWIELKGHIFGAQIPMMDHWDMMKTIRNAINVKYLFEEDGVKIYGPSPNKLLKFCQTQPLQGENPVPWFGGVGGRCWSDKRLCATWATRNDFNMVKGVFLKYAADIGFEAQRAQYEFAEDPGQGTLIPWAKLASAMPDMDPKEAEEKKAAAKAQMELHVRGAQMNAGEKARARAAAGVKPPEAPAGKITGGFEVPAQRNYYARMGDSLQESPDIFSQDGQAVYELNEGYSGMIWNGTVIGALHQGNPHFVMVMTLQQQYNLTRMEEAGDIGIFGPFREAAMKHIRKTDPKVFITEECQNVFRCWKGEEGAVFSSWHTKRALVQYFPQFVEYAAAIGFPYHEAMYEFMPKGSPLKTYEQLFLPDPEPEGPGEAAKAQQELHVRGAAMTVQQRTAARQKAGVVHQPVPATKLGGYGMPAQKNFYSHVGDSAEVMLQNILSEEVPGLPGIMYHLTAKANFSLDPKKRPLNNSTLGGDWDPGIFLTDSPEKWVNGYGYWRPWVAEFDTSALEPSDLRIERGVSGEVLVKAEGYPRLKLLRVIPLDAHAREAFGEPGWTEDFYQTDYRTDGPAPARGTLNDWRYQGNAADEPEDWRKAYAARIKKFAKQSGRENGVYGR